MTRSNDTRARNAREELRPGKIGPRSQVIPRGDLLESLTLSVETEDSTRREDYGYTEVDVAGLQGMQSLAYGRSTNVPDLTAGPGGDPNGIPTRSGWVLDVRRSRRQRKKSVKHFDIVHLGKMERDRHRCLESETPFCLL